LSERHGEAEADRILHTVITWGRHGEVFEYDYTTGIIRLPTGDEDSSEPAA
jgi:NitT/TauT family transport system ATP-binding protein